MSSNNKRSNVIACGLVYVSIEIFCNSAHAADDRTLDEAQGECFAASMAAQNVGAPIQPSRVAYIEKYMPQINSVMSKMQTCMQGKADNQTNFQICQKQVLNKSESEFYKGFTKIVARQSSITKQNYEQYIFVGCWFNQNWLR